MRVITNTKSTVSGIDQLAFEQLFDAYYNELQHFVYYKSGDAESAEDIVQEAFLKVWEIRSTIRIETARAFLYKITGNLFANSFKRKKLDLKLHQTFLEDRNFETPEFELEMKEFDQKLQKVLSNLDEKCRVVFLMNRIDKLTYREIAENLSISVKAVEKRMNKTLEQIRNEIEQKF